MVDPQAIVSPQAKIGEGAVIAPFAIVEANVEIGSGVQIEPFARICSGVKMGDNCFVGQGAVLGGKPQDMKFNGESAGVLIGDSCQFREYATIHASTQLDQPTRIGDQVLVMAYAHVAHDCLVDNSCILSNAVQLGGFVQLHHHVNIGGSSAVHQFCTLGAYSFVGGVSKIDRDLPPFSKAMGSPASWMGINRIGLERQGFSAERLSEIQKDFRNLYRSQRRPSEVLPELSGSEWDAFRAVRKMNLMGLRRK